MIAVDTPPPARTPECPAVNDSLPPEASRFESLKRAFDFGFAATLLVFTAPLIGALAVLVRLTSAGPAIYAQVRLGRWGRPYTMYKLRSMAHNCELDSGPTWSVPGDPRVTLIGRILRASHLDELPQLWNVLRGEMSLVGPRPERPEIVADLVREVPRYRERLAVPPGITGLAQVQLPPDEHTDGVRRKVMVDLYYIGRPSLWLDLKILAATALKVAGLPPQWRTSLLALPRAKDTGRAPALPRLDASLQLSDVT